MKPTPVKNLVEEISLRSNDALLPIFEPIINSINSINLKNPNKPSDGKIIVEIERRPENEQFLPPYPIKNVTVYDNGEGFTNANMESFEIPHSHKNKNLGCKGLGRFTCLAAFREMEVKSTYKEKNEWSLRHFKFDQKNEIQEIKNGETPIESLETIVRLFDYNNQYILHATAIELDDFAEKLMQHCLIYYLNEQLPDIKIIDISSNESINLKSKFQQLARENERDFEVKGEKFRAYILRNPKKSNRKHHYVHYCANSREVGGGKSLSLINKIFNYPLQKGGESYYLDVYVVSDYLDKKVNQVRNTLDIPSNRDNFFEDENTVVFTDIETNLAEILSDEFAEYMSRRKSILQLFDRLLEADEKGEYKLEEDIHKLIVPMGLSGNPSEEGHNLWLLDERFVTYSFIHSDIPIRRVTQNKSAKEPDVFMWQEGEIILEKPTAYGSSPSGSVNSLVVFEFKRPGETAHQKRKSDKQWLFSDLIMPYFDAFIYGDGKTNYIGKHVIVEKHTPKFGYVIVDVIPKELKEFNIDKGFNPTPYGTLYKIEPGLNLHIEVITFRQLIDSASLRHKPFFDRLFA